MNTRNAVRVGCVLSLVVVGCDRSAAPQQSHADVVSPTAASPASPAQTVEHIHRLRMEGRYSELAEYVEPLHATGTVEFLLAMDELLAANDEAQAAIRDSAPTAPSAIWDLGGLKNRQGVMSADVRVVEERVQGTEAKVTVQVADLVPLEVVALRKVNGRWVYCPESDVGTLPESLRGLAQCLRRIAGTIRHDSMQEAQIGREFRLCVSPRLKAIGALAAGQTKTGR